MTSLTTTQWTSRRKDPGRLLSAAMFGGALAAAANTALLGAGKAFGIAFLAPVGGPNAPLSLAYDSGAGNGRFSFGWSLSISSITPKTDKVLPQYLDAKVSDAFILSGAEHLETGLNCAGMRRKR